MATAFLIHGYLGSGKTTLARRLADEHNAIRFTHDDWMVQLYGRDPAPETFQDQFERVSALMESIWTRALVVGANVVLDLNFWTRRHRDHTRAILADIGATIVLYEVACSEETAWRRVEQRSADPNGGLLINRNTFDVLKQRFEPLDDDEVRETITT